MQEPIKAIISNLAGFPFKEDKERNFGLGDDSKELDSIKRLVHINTALFPGRYLSLFKDEDFLNRKKRLIKDFKELEKRYKPDIIVFTIFPEDEFHYPSKHILKMPKIINRAFKELNEVAKALNIPIIISVNSVGEASFPSWERLSTLFPSNDVIKVESDTLRVRNLEEEETVEELE